MKNEINRLSKNIESINLNQSKQTFFYYAIIDSHAVLNSTKK